MRTLFLLCFSACTLVHAQSNLSFVFPAMPVAPGGTALVGIVYTGPTDTSKPRPAALQFSLGIPPDVTAVSCAPGSVSVTLAQKQVSCSPITGGTMIVLLWGMNTDALSDGDVIDLGFKLKPSIPLLTESIAIGNVVATSNASTPIPTTLAASTITIPIATPCDVNSDGVVNVLDSQIEINEILGLAPFTAAADVNGDGKVDVLDLQMVINAALGVSPCRAGTGP